MLRQVKAY